MASRTVKDFNGVNDALRELYNFYDQFRTRNFDIHKRRVINAHPSIDDYDYVVRKELHDLVGGDLTPRRIFPKAVVSTVIYDKITFGIGIGSAISVGSSLTPPYIWTNSARGKPDIIATAANIPPTGSDLIIDIKQNGTSIFGATKLVMPAGTAIRQVVHSSSIFTTSLLFKRYDVFTVDVIQTGDNTSPGQEIEVVVFCNLI